MLLWFSNPRVFLKNLRLRRNISIITRSTVTIISITRLESMLLVPTLLRMLLCWSKLIRVRKSISTQPKTSPPILPQFSLPILVPSCKISNHKMTRICKLWPRFKQWSANNKWPTTPRTPHWTLLTKYKPMWLQTLRSIKLWMLPQMSRRILALTLQSMRQRMFHWMPPRRLLKRLLSPLTRLPNWMLPWTPLKQLLLLSKKLKKRKASVKSRMPIRLKTPTSMGNLLRNSWYQASSTPKGMLQPMFLWLKVMWLLTLAKTLPPMLLQTQLKTPPKLLLTTSIDHISWVLRNRWSSWTGVKSSTKWEP